MIWTSGMGWGEIRYIPFPEGLEAAYQSFTEADLERLRAAGYAEDFRPVESGVADYLSRIGGPGTH